MCPLPHLSIFSFSLFLLSSKHLKWLSEIGCYIGKQVQIASQSTISDTPVVRRIRRMHSSVLEVVDYSSQQVESQSPPSSGQPEQIVIRTSYDLNVRTVQLFKP
jgi:hypothetical protein